MNAQQRNDLRLAAGDAEVWSLNNPSSPLTDEHRAALRAHRLAQACDPNDGLTIRDAAGNISVVSRSRALAEQAKPQPSFTVAE